ncbi:MAG: hypothetical protein JWR28_3460, partial [Modestobacter sp.]|nr:hypothetical protein [Modestobacter sp.]
MSNLYPVARLIAAHACAGWRIASVDVTQRNRVINPAAARDDFVSVPSTE